MENIFVKVQAFIMPNDAYEQMEQNERMGMDELSEEEQLELCELRDQILNVNTISCIHKGNGDNMTTITFEGGISVTYPFNYEKFNQFLVDAGVKIHKPNLVV